MKSREELLKTKEFWLVQIQSDLFNALSEYMERENLNQTQLAEKLGVSKGYISQVLKGNFNYTISKLIELSLAIGKVPDLKFHDIGIYTRFDFERNKIASSNVFRHNQIELTMKRSIQDFHHYPKVGTLSSFVLIKAMKSYSEKSKLSQNEVSKSYVSANKFELA